MNILNKLPISRDRKDAILDKISQAIFDKRHCRVVTFNTEMLVEALASNDFMDAIICTDIMIVDGVGITFLLDGVKKYAGIDLAGDLLDIANSHNMKIALWGASINTIQKAHEKLQKQYPGMQTVFCHDGFYHASEEDSLVKKLIESQPNITFIALPFQRAETLIAHKLKNLHGLVMGVGGSFDVWAGEVQRAPYIFQEMKLEWLWRLCLQPQRLHAQRRC